MFALKAAAQKLSEPRFFIRTFGCQQNVSDSERIAGILIECGYKRCEEPAQADLILFNTCAVREHAEDRVFGNVGELKKYKRENPSLIIAVGGCMVQQQHIAEKLQKSYPYVDLIFNTNRLDLLPGEIAQCAETRGALIAPKSDRYSIVEDLPIRRDEGFRAHIPIMFGCDNFCTYCIVPYVRGRERSRSSADVVEEFKNAVAQGYKDIMLLGQNVNSYGKGLAEQINFAALLERLNDVEGDFTIRFMTSHPKDATKELFDTIARCKKISRQIHLPVQSGSNRILREMNRGYTREEYLALIDYARSVIDGVSFTSDIIVGFPGETEQDYNDTVDLVRHVGFRSLFTFIYSKREGTRAAVMPDFTDHKTKAQRLNALVAIQDEITERQESEYVGKTFRMLVVSKLADGKFEARMDDNSAITVEGDCQLNAFHNVTVTERTKKRLYGKVV